MDKQPELQDSPTPEAVPQAEDLESLQGNEKLVFETVEELEAELQKTRETNKKLYARAKTAEAKAKEVKPAPVAPIAKVEEKPKDPQSEINSPVTPKHLERLELKVDGYSDAEVEFIMASGGKASLQNEFVKSAIEGLRAKAKAEDATPEVGSKSPIFKQYTERELRAMSSKELEKILPHADY